ncbi:MAG: SUF system Fe-S cluster assembly protein [Candidatus Omnitrophica bacterium]|nr:SUF system Fe-S cluster assembly protein [Candidatus Omnitrophota bacterium]
MDKEQLKDHIVQALKTVYDPEIPIDIYELGLIYGLEINDEGEVDIRMTLTSPACPEAQSIPPAVQRAAERVEGVAVARVELVWEPPWDKNMMSEAARLHLGFF